MRSRDDELRWIPLWIDKWLFGSTRIELQPDERSVWIDLMVLSAKDGGYIQANVGVPYPSQQLAGMLCIQEELLKRTIDRCRDPKINKIVQNEDGTLFLPNWQEYQLSPRHKRRFAVEKAEMSPKEDAMSPKEDTPDSTADTRGEDRIGEDRIGEKKPFDKSKRAPSHPKTVSEFIEELKKSPAYSHLNIDEQIEKIKIWLLKPENKGKQLTSGRILNWLNKEPKPMEVSDGKPPTDVVKRRLWDLEQDERRRSEAAQKNS